MGTTGTYRLTANITMRSWDPAFVPIGSPFNPFRGTFDGNGFTINNLRIGTGGGWYTGMFGATDGASLDRIRLNNVTVSGGSFTGAIAGIMRNTTLKRSSVSGTVTAPTSGSPMSAVGMAVGQARDYSRIERCSATGTVSGRSNTIGGFFGEIVTEGFFDANRNGPPAIVSEVFTNVNVNPTITTGTHDIVAGGLVGYVRGADMVDINTVGRVHGRGKVGGIVGHMDNSDPDSHSSILDHGISRGSVTASSGSPAGTVGYLTGSSPRCIAFYDLSSDPGTPLQFADGCNTGQGSFDLKAPYQDPWDPRDTLTRVIGIYILGDIVTQDEIDDGTYQQCMLGSGSDTDWGVGTCGRVQTWSLNSGSQYSTLARIPDPSIQPR
jgi:hypothetical protein